MKATAALATLAALSCASATTLSSPPSKSEAAAPGPRRPLVGVLRRTGSVARKALQPHKLFRQHRQPAALKEFSGGSVGWPIFACWAYFLSVALTAPAMPGLCNSIANADGSTKVSPGGVDLKGTFESVDQLMTFFFDPLWGAVSDHVGRKPLQLLACAGITVGWGTAALSRSIPMLLLGRALDGVTSCMLPICQSAVQDITPPHKLVSQLGLLQGVAVGAAFLIGGMAGGIISKLYSPRHVFALASTTALLAGIAIALFAPETLPVPRRAAKVAWARGNALAALHRLGENRASFGASAAFLCFWLGLNGLQVTAPHSALLAAVGKRRLAPCIGGCSPVSHRSTSNAERRHFPPSVRSLPALIRTRSRAFALALACPAPMRSTARRRASRQANMYNYASYRFGWEPSTAVGLQAGSGIVLALSNVLGPKLLAPRIGDAGVIRLGMLGFALCLAAMGFCSTGKGFSFAVLGGSVATMCLPGLTGLIAQQAPPGQAGAMLTALDSVSTLDRLVAYKLMSRLFAWGISNKQPSIHFYVGSACVLGGWLFFESMIRAVAAEREPAPGPPAKPRRAAKL